MTRRLVWVLLLALLLAGCVKPQRPDPAPVLEPCGGWLCIPV